jgi:outer membrane protein OmpA-like peptidoglycan-associated protein
MNSGSAPMGHGVLVAERSSSDVLNLIDLTEAALADAGPNADRLIEAPAFRSSRVAAVLVGLGGLAAVIAAGVLLGVPSAERHLRADVARHALPTSGKVIAEVDGRDVILRGEVASPADRQAIVDRVRARWGVEEVDASAVAVVRPAARRVTTKPSPPKRAATALVAGPTRTSTIPVSTTIAPDPGAPLRLKTELASLRRTSRLVFTKSSPELTSSSGPALDALAAAMRVNPAPVQVEAHTDASGDPARNAALSQLRAEAVREALISRGVDAGLLVAIGRGEASPIASNVTAAGRDRNRRVEFVVVEKPA